MASLQQKHILLVEYQNTLSMTTAMPERSGYGVTARTEGLKAPRAFSEEPDRFDLALPDQKLPYLTGLELAQRMRYIRLDIDDPMTHGDRAPTCRPQPTAGGATGRRKEYP